MLPLWYGGEACCRYEVVTIRRDRHPPTTRERSYRPGVDRIGLAVPNLVCPAIVHGEVAPIRALGIKRPAARCERATKGLHRGIRLRREIAAHQTGPAVVVILVRINGIPGHFKSYRPPRNLRTTPKHSSGRSADNSPDTPADLKCVSAVRIRPMMGIHMV